MKRKTAKSLSVILMSSFIIGSIFSGCTQENDNVLTTALSYHTTTSFSDGDTALENEWTRSVESELGFKLEYKFAVPSTDYDTKIGMDIGTGKTPQIFHANINQMPTLIDAGMIEPDLGSLYEQYATDLTKQVMGWDNALGINSPSFKAAVHNGKLTAIPWTESAADTSNVLYIRKDWLDGISEDAPKTISELERILRKFNDTYNAKGMAACNQVIYGNMASISGIFNIFGAYPQIWVEKEIDGLSTLDYGFFQPEMKEGLAKLKSWYSEGLLYKDFHKTKAEDVSSKIASGEIGVWMGVMSLPLTKMNSAVAIYGADWIACPVPGKDLSTPALITNSSALTKFHVVKKGYKYPERLIQLMNMFTEKLWGEGADFSKFNRIASLFPSQAWPVTKNLDAYKAITAALSIDKNTDWWNNAFSEGIPGEWAQSGEAPAFYSLNSEQQYYYYKISDYLLYGLVNDSEARNWAYTRIFYAYEDISGKTMVNGNKGYDSSESVIEYYVNNNYFYKEKNIGFDTPTMQLARGDLETEISILIKNIITGVPGWDLNKFDSRVNELRNDSKGAGKIIEEVNARYKNGQ